MVVTAPALREGDSWSCAFSTAGSKFDRGSRLGHDPSELFSAQLEDNIGRFIYSSAAAEPALYSIYAGATAGNGAPDDAAGDGEGYAPGG